jgi:N6-adenosine-specific RNA methylase IME4
MKNIIRAPVGKHSEKPEVFRELIEKLTVDMPDRAMLEMFARKHTPGWSVWGNQV